LATLRPIIVVREGTTGLGMQLRLVAGPLSDAAAANLERFVEAGGTVVVSFFSGIVDPSDHVRLGGYPGAFRRLLGLRVEDFTPLGSGKSIDVRLETGAAGSGVLWSELIEPEGAEVIGSFIGGDLEGRPAVTQHGFGRGVSYYVGTRLDPRSMEQLLRRAWTEAGVTAVLDAPPGVEAVRRHTRDGGSLLFLLNHGDEAVTVAVPAGAGDLLSGSRVGAQGLRLDPRGVAVLTEASNLTAGEA